MSSRGAQKSPGKPPSLSKVGRVSGGRRKVDRIGKFTALERWLHSETKGQEAGTGAGPERRQGSSNSKGKELGGRMVGISQQENKEGNAGGVDEPACPEKEETLSQKEV